MLKRAVFVMVAGIMAVCGLVGCSGKKAAQKASEAASTIAVAAVEMAEGADSDWYMKALADKDLTSQYSYCKFIDVNKDGVPVLIMSTTDKAFIGDEDKACLMVYDANEPKVVKEIGGAGGESFYYDDNKNVLTYFSRLSGEGHLEVCEVKNGELNVVKKLDQYAPHHNPDEDNDKEIFRIDGKDVSEKEFNDTWQEYAKENFAVTYEAIK